VLKAFEFVESFSTLIKLALADFQEWWALCCPGLFKRGFFIRNIFGGFKNW
jgi:hypothetical protein